jgi:imidazolonepropionase-like amidohydrolase
VFCHGCSPFAQVTVYDGFIRLTYSIVIRNDKIVAVEDGFVAPGQARLIDLSRATVLPGLIDCHKHLSMHFSGPDRYKEMLTETPVDAAFYAANNARITLLNGFTSVRNVGAEGRVDLATRRAIEKGLIIGPRMWISEEQIGPTGGHSDPTNGVAPGVVIPMEGNSVADSPEEIRKLVREHKKYGTDLIKIMPSGGVGSIGDDPKRQLMADDEIQAAIETAHALGMKVAAHAHGKSAIDATVRYGVDSIEHGTYADAESFRLMKEHGTYLVPTVYVARVLFDTAKEHPEKLPPNIVAKIQAITPVIESMFTNAYHAGVKIAFGTDTGGDFRTGTPAKELTDMVRLGMTPWTRSRPPLPTPPT